MGRPIFPGYVERFRAALAAKGMKPADVARGTGIDQQKLSRWVRGGLPDSLAELEKVAAFLGAPWQWFLVGDEGAEAIARYRRTRAAVPAKPQSAPRPGRRAGRSSAAGAG
jgi:transcriptional regulator with XRE-family HTH domain